MGNTNASETTSTLRPLAGESRENRHLLALAWRNKRQRLWRSSKRTEGRWFDSGAPFRLRAFCRNDSDRFGPETQLQCPSLRQPGASLSGYTRRQYGRHGGCRQVDASQGYARGKQRQLEANEETGASYRRLIGAGDSARSQVQHISSDRVGHSPRSHLARPYSRVTGSTTAPFVRVPGVPK